jgi:Protein of unknown function (DUF3306)
MSDTETFLSRWLRLKRESEASLPPEDAPAAEPAAAAFDPSSLPPIESIVADSDIRAFLHEAVPAELTRAALRSAWTADPAIRDFVGIAENQWNFNDAACIPGFGPLQAADYLVAQALAGQMKAPETPQEPNGAEQPALPRSEPLEAVRLAAAPPALDKSADAAATASAAATAGAGETASVGKTGVGETMSGAAAPRVHGGALPQ